jgi:hypothetical protein
MFEKGYLSIFCIHEKINEVLTKSSILNNKKNITALLTDQHVVRKPEGNDQASIPGRCR